LAGRRSGKTVTIAALAAYLAACVDYSGIFARGERGILPVMAGTVVQARSLMNVDKSIFTEIPCFSALVDNITADTISLTNRVDIQIRPANYRSIRGIIAVAAICEEISTWQDSELGYRNPDIEILAAIRPASCDDWPTAISIGSPYGKSGEPYRISKKHFGPNGCSDIIVANGAS
jgi:hypothetical protein